MIDNDTVATTARQLRLILDAIERGDHAPRALWSSSARPAGPARLVAAVGACALGLRRRLVGRPYTPGLRSRDWIKGHQACLRHFGGYTTWT